MEASGWLLAWVAVQTRGQGAPSAALCLLFVSESACEGSQPSSSPSALRASRSMIWVATSEPTRCVFAGCAMCASSCTTSISLHTRSTCVVSHYIFGMLGVHGCVIAMLDVRSCVFAKLELTCVMLGVHGCVIAMCAGSCTEAISACIRNI